MRNPNAPDRSRMRFEPDGGVWASHLNAVMLRRDSWTRTTSPSGVAEVFQPRALGGAVRFFVCPECRTHRRHLYWLGMRWVCRVCTGYPYASASVGPGARRSVVVAMNRLADISATEVDTATFDVRLDRRPPERGFGRHRHRHERMRTLHAEAARTVGSAAASLLVASTFSAVQSAIRTAPVLVEFLSLDVDEAEQWVLGRLCDWSAACRLLDRAASMQGGEFGAMITAERTAVVLDFCAAMRRRDHLAVVDAQQRFNACSRSHVSEAA